MTVIVAALTGFVGGRMLWLAMRKSWSRQAFLRQNYQGVTMPTAAGIVLSLTMLLVEGIRSIFASAGIGDGPGLTSLRAAAFVVVLAFTLLGLLDDLVGTSGAKGFGGHAQALMRGELTSGMIKFIGGGAAALVGASLIGSPGIGKLLVDAIIIALSANVFNLLDLRPGRTTKAGLGLFVILALAAAFDTALVPTAIVVGAAAALLLDDLHERLMLGDTGANALGAALGLGLATQVSGTTRIATLAVLVLLNVLSEFVSFSKVIDTVPPLRVLDQMGRRRPPVIDLREDEFAFDAAASMPLSPYGDPNTSPYSSAPYSTSSQAASPYPPAPIPPGSPGRGNVGGARDADRTESADAESPYRQDDSSDLPDEPSDLFGVSEDDFLSTHEPFGDPHDHRHN